MTAQQYFPSPKLTPNSQPDAILLCLLLFLLGFLTLHSLLTSSIFLDRATDVLFVKTCARWDKQSYPGGFTELAMGLEQISTGGPEIRHPSLGSGASPHWQLDFPKFPARVARIGCGCIGTSPNCRWNYHTLAMGLLLLSPETSPNWEQKEWNVSNSAVELHNVGRWHRTFPDLAVELLQVGSGIPPNWQWRK